MENVDVIALRKFIGLKQTEFSGKLGIAQSYLSEIERGLKPLTEEVHNKIVNTFESDLKQYLKHIGDNIANNKGNINTGSIGGHQVSVSGSGYEKIIGADKIELITSEANKLCLQEVASLKAEILRLEALIKSKDDTIKSKDDTIKSKDDTIEILKNR